MHNNKHDDRHNDRHDDRHNDMHSGRHNDRHIITIGLITCMIIGMW